MALLERVSTLVRANLNDLVDKAEHPEKMIKQVILDMQNQLLQVKTQVAIAIADQHLLEKKQKENEDKVAEWMRKAELAVDKKQDDLARAALQRVESYRDLSEGFAQQVTDQKAQVENLKTALRQLEQKLTEAQAKADLLIAQHRRARAVGKASDAKMAAGNGSSANAFDRMKRKVAHAEAHSQAKSEIAADDVEERLAALEKGRPHRAVAGGVEGERGGMAYYFYCLRAHFGAFGVFLEKGWFMNGQDQSCWFCPKKLLLHRVGHCLWGELNKASRMMGRRDGTGRREG